VDEVVQLPIMCLAYRNACIGYLESYKILTFKQTSSMNNVLVTGGAGFIGLHLVRKLLSSPQNYGVAVIDDLSNNRGTFLSKIKHQIKSSCNKPFSFYKEDIRNRAAVSDIISRERIDTCIHLAARVNVPYSLENPADVIDVNVRGTLEVLEACAQNVVKNFIFASSAAVYGNPIKLPLAEECPVQPLSPYGASKAAGEALLSSYRHFAGIRNAISLRIFNVYGPGQNPAYAGVITSFAQRLECSQKPLIYGDGNQTRDFIHVSDVVDCIILAAQNQIYKIPKRSKMQSRPYLPFPLGVFNVGTGVPTSITALAKRMIAIFGSDQEPIYYVGRDKEEIKYSYADTSKAKYFLKFQAIENLDSGLKRIIAPR
jgi:UDP-glucose 4-epimerase